MKIVITINYRTFYSLESHNEKTIEKVRFFFFLVKRVESK